MDRECVLATAASSTLRVPPTLTCSSRVRSGAPSSTSAAQWNTTSAPTHRARDRGAVGHVARRNLEIEAVEHDRGHSSGGPVRTPDRPVRPTARASRLPRNPVAPVTTARTVSASGQAGWKTTMVTSSSSGSKRADRRIPISIETSSQSTRRRHHARSLVELDDRGDVGHLLVERREVVLEDGRPRVERARAGRLDPVDVVAPTRRAEVPRVVVDLVARTAVTQQQATVARRVPELASVCFDRREVEPRCGHGGRG